MKFFDRRWLVNGLLIFSLLLNVAIFGYLARSGGLRRMFIKLDLAEPVKSREDFQKELEAKYRKYPNTAAEVIFAGDSLVGGGPWAEFYTEIHNRGIGAESTAGFLGRLDEITESKPLHVLLLIGTNDLAVAIPEVQIFRNYRTILERLRQESPKSVVTVIGLFPVNSTLPQPTQTNAEILSVNRQLKSLVGEFPGVRFLDLTSYLADGSGNLRRDFTTDGIHLTLDGYLAIRKPIQEALAR